MYVIEKVIEQITIQKEGEDRDPSAVIANLDMRIFMDSLSNVESMKLQEVKYHKQLEKSRRLEKELDANLASTVDVVVGDSGQKIAVLKGLLMEKVKAADPLIFDRLVEALVMLFNSRHCQRTLKELNPYQS
jgi:hypothetical protein